jgi:hypothetical protein
MKIHFVMIPLIASCISLLASTPQLDPLPDTLTIKANNKEITYVGCSIDKRKKQDYMVYNLCNVSGVDADGKPIKRHVIPRTDELCLRLRELLLKEKFEGPLYLGGEAEKANIRDDLSKLDLSALLSVEKTPSSATSEPPASSLSLAGPPDYFTERVTTELELARHKEIEAKVSAGIPLETAEQEDTYKYFLACDDINDLSKIYQEALRAAEPGTKN